MNKTFPLSLSSIAGKLTRAGQGSHRVQTRRLLVQGGRKVLALRRAERKRPPGSTPVAEGGLAEQLSGPRTPFCPLSFPPSPIQVSVLAEGRTSCDDGIQCPVCLLLRAFLLLITKQPDALLPSVVLSLQRSVLGLRGTVMHNSIYSHLQPSVNASCFTARQLYYFSFFSHVCERISHRFPGTLCGS